MPAPELSFVSPNETVPSSAALRPMLDPARTALLIIDAQVDFIAPDGAMAGAGMDMSAIPPTLDRVRALIAAARDAGATPVFIRVVTRDETDSDALLTLMERKGHGAQAAAICRAGSRGAEFYGVTPEEGEMTVDKPLFSSFVGTTLDADLRAAGIDTLLVCGFTTDCCVESTVRDAFHRNFHVFVAADACTAGSPDMHEGALRGMAKNCALLTDTATVLASWQAY